MPLPTHIPIWHCFQDLNDACSCSAFFSQDLKDAMVERHIEVEFQDHVRDNVLHFIEDFNRISCKDEAYLLNTIPSRLMTFQLPRTWQLLTNFIRDEQLKNRIQRSIQWLYFTPKTRIGTVLS